MKVKGPNRGAFERALVHALRLAAVQPEGAPSPVIEPDLARFVDGQTAEGLASDLVAIVEEINLTQPARALLKSPREPALSEPELGFLFSLAALQASDVCGAIAGLSRMLRDGRIGRVLFPMKFLAVRLELAGVKLEPIGARRFTVIAGGRRGPPRRAARPLLTVAS